MPGDRPAVSDMLRLRAELYLRHQLATMPGWPKHYSQLPPNELGRRGYQRDEHAHVLQQFRGAVEVLRRLGTLGQQEALAWLSRFEAALDEGKPCSSEPDRDPAVEHRARRMLEEHLQPIEGDATAEDEHAAMSRFEDALKAVRLTAALSREELEEWSSRVAEAAPTQGEDILRRRREAQSPWQATALERVIVGPTARHAGLQITHAELYADALVLHWHRVAAIEVPQDRTPSRAERDRAVHAAYPRLGWPDLQVTDELGTAYRSMAPGGPFREYAQADDVVVVWGSARFRPAVSEDACELRVAIDGAVLTLPLDA